MSYGLVVRNSHGTVQIDGEYVNSRLVAAGSVSSGGYPAGSGYYGAAIHLGAAYALSLECPVVLIKPSQPAKFVGSFMAATPATATWASGNGSIFLQGQCPFDYAIFSTKGSPIEDSDPFGLVVRNAAGSIVFSSNRLPPRVTALFERPAQTWGWPSSYGLSGLSEMPWILANPLMQTWKGIDEFSEQVGCVMAAVSADFTTLTVQMMDAAQNRVFPNIAAKNNYNPYHARKGWFGVADYA